MTKTIMIEAVDIAALVEAINHQHARQRGSRCVCVQVFNECRAFVTYSDDGQAEYSPSFLYASVMTDRDERD